MELPKFKLKKYVSAKNIVIAAWKPFGMTYADLKKSQGFGFDKDGNKIEISIDDEISAIEDMGLWGFFDRKTNTIHYWHDGKRTKEEVAHLIGHEIGHFLVPERKTLKASIREEMKCEEFGMVAAATQKLISMMELP